MTLYFSCNDSYNQSCFNIKTFLNRFLGLFVKAFFVGFEK
ncbi:hypothetical protein HPGAM_02730 [Helicobacter pylori Gambia94/24]|nr:hypothetical protein HPGAM_02730 [Helicobacter pylori Gambia94/24]